MIKGEIYEVKCERMAIPSTQKNTDIRFRGNISYGNVLGVNIFLEDNNGAPYNGDVSVSVREIGGSNRVLYSPQPYRLMKHSEDVPYIDRFLETQDLKGNGCDVGFNIDTSRVNVALVAYATILYSKSK